MKFTVIVARHTITGVPLAQARLASALAARGHEVDLIIGFAAKDLPLPELDNVGVIYLNRPKTRNILFDMIGYLRKEKPDAVFSAEDHLNAIVIAAALLSGSKTKISGSSRIDPRLAYSRTPLSKRWFLKQLMRALMWRADALTCVSKDMVNHYRALFRNAPHVGVYNIMDTDKARNRIEEAVDHPWFTERIGPILVAAGKLDPVKGFPDLISAAHMVMQNQPIRLAIFGEGPQRAELQAQIDGLGLSESIRLEGNVTNPLKYFAHADAFVLSSISEGMPNVLIEAMMAGCTPVATDCETGPREILESGRYGYLVPVRDPVALAGGIENALRNPVPPEVLAEALKPFQEDAVLAEHFRLLGL